MYPLAIILLGALLLAGSFAFSLPRDAALITRTEAESTAANFWAYRDALIAYRLDHVGLIDGTTITITDLTSPKNYTLTGYSDRGLWSNVIQNGLLYTYSNQDASFMPASTIDAIANYRGRSLMIGIAQAGNTMTSTFNYPTGVKDTSDPTGVAEYPAGHVTFSNLPNIPPGRLVVIGN